MNKKRPNQRRTPKTDSGGRNQKRGADRPSERDGPSDRERNSRGGSRRPRRSTRSPAERRGLGGDQVEGRQAVRELLLAGTRRVREVYVIDDLDAADIIEDIIELANEMSVPLRPVSRRHFDTEALTESHQGVLARADSIGSKDLDNLAQVKGAFLLVLDGITDPGNLGAILRTAECAGVTGVVMPKHRAVHISPTVTKTAAGAVEHLDMTVVGGIPTALKRLTDLGVYTVGLEAGGETGIFDLPLETDTPVALVLGAEGKGLSRLARERVDALAAIPLNGRLNSLNVAMAAAVACFEVVRKRQLPHSSGGDS